MNETIKALKIPVLTVTISLIIFFILVKIFGPIPFAVNSLVSNTSEMFSATGTAEATGKPDKASFTAGVTKTATTTEAAQEALNQTINNVTTALKKLGIAEKDIKTSDYSINPNTDFTNNKQTITGYTANSSVTVTLDRAETASKAIDAATAAGANVVGGVSFVINDDDREKLEDQARAEAIKNAKEKAAKISQQAGIRLGRVISIVESNNGPIAYDTRAANEITMAKQSAPTQLETGENKITVSVTLTFDTN